MKIALTKITKPKSQISLPPSNKMMAPKKVNAVLDVQSDAAVGMPSKVKTLPKSDKAMKMKNC